jgi:hypothetical protein
MMKRNYEFREVTEAEWEGFLAGWKPADGEAEPSFFQTTERVRKRREMGYGSYFLGVFDRGRLVGGGVLMGRGGEFWMAYGPLIDFSNKPLAE